MQTSTQDVAGARQEALDALLSFARGFHDGVTLRRGIAGDGAATLAVPGANRRVYVELGGAGGPVVEALYDQFTPTLGDGVFLMKPRVFGPGSWLILGQASGASLPCVEL